MPRKNAVKFFCSVLDLHLYIHAVIVALFQVNWCIVLELMLQKWYIVLNWGYRRLQWFEMMHHKDVILQWSDTLIHEIRWLFRKRCNLWWMDMNLQQRCNLGVNHCLFSEEASCGYINLVSSTGLVQNFQIKNSLPVSKIFCVIT